MPNTSILRVGILTFSTTINAGYTAGWPSFLRDESLFQYLFVDVGLQPGSL